jgi:RHS repeat-associated protein
MNGLFADSDLDRIATRISLERVVRMPRIERVGIRGFATCRLGSRTGDRRAMSHFSKGTPVVKFIHRAAVLMVASGSIMSQSRGQTAEDYDRLIFEDMGCGNQTIDCPEPCQGTCNCSDLAACGAIPTNTGSPFTCVIAGTGDGIQGGLGGKDITDPVDLGSGDFIYRLPLIEGSCVGPRLTFTLTYRSKTGYDDRTFGYGGNSTTLPAPRYAIGRNWDHSHNIFISPELRTPPRQGASNGDKIGTVVHTGDGQVTLYRPTVPGGGAGGCYEDPADPRIKYCAAPIAEDAVIDGPNQTKYRFPTGSSATTPAEVNRLKRITDRDANELEFFYHTTGPVGQLAAVTDDCGRSLVFEYATMFGRPMLVTVSEVYQNGQSTSTLRTVHFEYYTGAAGEPGNAGDLESVTLSSPQAGDPDQVWSFTYYRDGVQPHQTNLESITEPGGRLVLFNEYDASPQPATPFDHEAYDPVFRRYDSVIRQTMPGDDDTIPDRLYDYVYFAGTGAPNQEANYVEAPTLVVNRAGDVKLMTFGAGARTNWLLERVDFLKRATDREAMLTWARNLATSWDGNPNQVVTYLGSPIDPVAPSFVETKYAYDGTGEHAGRLREATFPTLAGGGNSSSVVKGYALGRPINAYHHARDGDLGPSVYEEWAYPSGSCGCASAGAYRRFHPGVEPDPKWDWEKTYDNRERLTNVRRGALDGDLTTPADPNGKEDGEIAREEYDYNDRGQIVAHRVVTSYTPLTKTATAYEYYGMGSDVALGRRGRLKAVTRNPQASAGALDQERTEFDYDVFGRVVAEKKIKFTGTSAEVQRTQEYTRNGFGWVTAQRVRDSAGVVVESTLMSYDNRGNLVREDVGRWNPGETPESGDPVTTIREYDKYDRLVRVCTEIGTVALSATQVSTTSPINLPAHTDLSGFTFATTEYGYDANDNVVLVKLGEAASSPARQPGNIVSRVFDCRNLLVSETKGTGAFQSTTVHRYDNRGRRSQTIEGFGTTAARTMSYKYDVLDRVRQITDAEDTQTNIVLGTHGTITDRFVVGRATANGPATLTLSYERRELDSLGRPKAIDQFLFTPVSSYQPPTQNYNGSSVGYTYTADGLIESRSTARSLVGSTEFFQYDALRRTTRHTDAEGNIVRYTYDGSSNVSKVERLEFLGNNDPGVTNQYPVHRFTVHYSSDDLDRLVLTQTPDGESMQMYDSRGNVVRTVDELGTPTDFVYDGLGREIATHREMTGSPDTAPWCIASATDPISTLQAWDLSSRLTAQIDDNGNRTSYWYDDRGWLTLTRMADGTIHSIGWAPTSAVSWDGFGAPVFPSDWNPGYDAVGNAVAALDANGSSVSSVFDAVGRVTGRTITPGPGAGAQGSYPVVGSNNGATGTGFETYTYDGLGRLLSAVDDDSEVVRVYDSLSRLTNETTRVAGWTGSSSIRAATSASPARTVAYQYNRAGEVTRIEYPGGRVINYTRDVLGRTISITEGAGATPAGIAAYAYRGPSRVSTRTHANGTQISYEWNGFDYENSLGGNYMVGTSMVGFYRPRSVISHLSTDPSNVSSPIDRRALLWDVVGNKVGIQNTYPSTTNPARTYEYDRANRLVLSTSGQSAETAYVLDGVHNRLQVCGTIESGAQIGQYGMSEATDPAADKPVNQYTSVPLDTAFYDENGNLVQLGVQAGGGLLMALGVQESDPALQAGVADSMAQGGLWADVTSDGTVAADDLNLAIEMLGDTGLLGQGGGCEDPFGTECGPLRLAYFRYDYRNQLVEHEDVVAGSTTRYAYDALGRRLLKAVDATNLAGGVFTQYVHGGQASWQILAELSGLPNDPSLASAAPTTTYVYGNYIDEPITMRRDYDGPSGSPPQDLFFHQDDLFSTVAMTAGPDGATIPGVGTFAAGQVVERYRYGDYGLPSFFSASGSTDLGYSATGMTLLFTGREWDAETRLYQYRTRYMEPTWGRFTTRDTIGTWGDLGSTGNSYAFGRSSPTQFVDPFGTKSVNYDSPGGAFQQCLTLPTISARIHCFEELIGALPTTDPRKRAAEKILEGLKKARDAERARDVKEKVDKVKRTHKQACDAVYNEYKVACAAELPCVQGVGCEASLLALAAKVACAEGRRLHVKMGCHRYSNDPARTLRNHQNQLEERDRAVSNCKQVSNKECRKECGVQ